MAHFAYFLFFGERCEWIAHLLKSNERCEGIAQVAHQKWATMSDLLRSLIKNERCERIAQVTHQKWANERIARFLSESLIRSVNRWCNYFLQYYFTALSYQISLTVLKLLCIHKFSWFSFLTVSTEKINIFYLDTVGEQKCYSNIEM